MADRRQSQSPRNLMLDSVRKLCHNAKHQTVVPGNATIGIGSEGEIPGAFDEILNGRSGTRRCEFQARARGLLTPANEHRTWR
nr:MAG TPA: hypothetical protein [Caudoviricetes sp.]